MQNATTSSGPVTFKGGRYYESYGTYIHVMDITVETYCWGLVLLAETSKGIIAPVPDKPGNATGWVEISKDDFEARISYKE